MKLKFLSTMLAVAGLFVVPAFAEHHAEGKAKTEAAAENEVAAYVVAVSGGG